MKKILCFVLFLFVVSVHAQIGFEKGYFIDNSGAKTICYIKNIDWRSNPTNFSYKINPEDDAVQTESITTVSEFAIDNFSKYRRFKVKMERSSNVTWSLQKDKSPIWKEEILFLKILVEGNASLYSFSDTNMVKFFFETQTQPIEQLVSIRYLTDSGNHIDQYNPFRQQLHNYVRCDKTSDSKIKNMKYEISDLVAHFVTYNNCFKEDLVNYEAKADRKKFALKFTPGVFMASLDVRLDQTQYNVSTKIDKTIFKIGFETEYILPFNKGKWSVFLNPVYYTFKTTSEYMKNDGVSNNGNDINYIATVDYSSIELPVGIRYNLFVNPASKLFLNAAFVFDLPLSSKLDFTNRENLLNGKRSFKLEGNTHMAFGVGYAYKKFSLEVRMNTTGNLLSNFGTWKANHKTTGLVLGYDFL